MPPPSLAAAQDQASLGGASESGACAATARRRGGKKVHPVPQLPGGAEAAETGATGGGEWGRRLEWLSVAGVGGVLRRHPLAALFGCGLLLFMGVEYTIPMVPPSAPPLDLGFAATAALHAGLAARPWLNSLLAALNTERALSTEEYYGLRNT